MKFRLCHNNSHCICMLITSIAVKFNITLSHIIDGDKVDFTDSVLTVTADCEDGVKQNFFFISSIELTKWINELLNEIPYVTSNLLKSERLIVVPYVEFDDIEQANNKVSTTKAKAYIIDGDWLERVAIIAAKKFHKEYCNKRTITNRLSEKLRKKRYIHLSLTKDTAQAAGILVDTEFNWNTQTELNGNTQAKVYINTLNKNNTSLYNQKQIERWLSNGTDDSEKIHCSEWEIANIIDAVNNPANEDNKIFKQASIKIPITDTIHTMKEQLDSVFANADTKIVKKMNSERIELNKKMIKDSLVTLLKKSYVDKIEIVKRSYNSFGKLKKRGKKITMQPSGNKLSHIGAVLETTYQLSRYAAGYHDFMFWTGLEIILGLLINMIFAFIA